MGAWGINTFENDGALDWLGDFLEEPTEKRIRDTFSPSTNNQGGLFGKLFGRKPAGKVPDLDGEHVLAAAEVVATILGSPSKDNPDELKDPPKLSLGPSIATQAKLAIESILDSSNLKDCWEETDDYQEWLLCVADIRSRLDQC